MLPANDPQFENARSGLADLNRPSGLKKHFSGLARFSGLFFAPGFSRWVLGLFSHISALQRGFSPRLQPQAWKLLLMRIHKPCILRLLAAAWLSALSLAAQAADHAAQLDKRSRKLTGYDYGPAWATVEGAGDIAVVTWGSCTGPAREAIARAAEHGVLARLVAPRLLSPALPSAMAAALAGARRVLVVEQSHSGQFHKHLRAEYDLPGEVESFHRPGPLPMRPGEILARLLEMGERP